MPLVALRVVPESLLRKRLELHKICAADVVSALMTIPVVISMAWMGFGVWALVAGGLVAPLVQSTINFSFVRWKPGLRVGSRRFRDVLHYSLATLGSRICWALYEQADAFVLGKGSGDAVLGFYSMAKQLTLFPVEKISGVVNQLMGPVMAELQADKEGMRAAFLRVVRLVAWTAFPLCVGLMLMAQDLVQVTLTEKWMTAVPMIQVLCLYAMIRSLAVLFPPVLMARYRAKFLFSYNVVLLGVMPAAFWAGSVWWGAMGVAVAWVAVYPIVLASMAREALQAISLSPKTLWRHLWPPMAATSVMVATVLIVYRGASSWRDGLVVSRLALAALAGTAAYGTALLGCGGPVRGEIQELAGWMFRSGRPLTVAK